MRASLVLTLLALAGCDRPLTNQEIVEQTAYCRAHGLGVVTYEDAYSGLGNTTRPQLVAIQCQPKEETP